MNARLVRWVWATGMLLVLLPGLARAEITLIGVATIPGDSSDLSQLTDKLSDGTPHNQLGGFSAMTYTGRGHEYLQLPDRGPKDGATDYICRVHRMDVHVVPGTERPISIKLTATLLLKNEQEQPFIGAFKALKSDRPENSVQLDPEGLRVGKDGTLYISEEYGPNIFQFDAKGKLLRRFSLPKHYSVSHRSSNADEELPPTNKSGRQPNRGMEGLAISPDGSKLYGIMQSPLIQDGALSGKNKRIGLHVRLLELDIKSGKTREFVYPLDRPNHGINEILAVNTEQFLVLERDGKEGLEAAYKKLALIDISKATDVSNVAALPATALPPEIQPVKKQPFLDLLDPRFKIRGPQCPGKIESLAFGPPLPDGRLLLFVTSDNDFLPKQPTLIYAFAVDRSDLPGYQPQQFDDAR